LPRVPDAFAVLRGAAGFAGGLRPGGATVDAEHVFRRVVTSPGKPIELWLEPTGQMFRLPPGRELEIVCRGATSGDLEEERHPLGHIALHAWPGAHFSVYEAGIEIYAEPDGIPEFPTMPGGTVRQMLEMLFGSFETRRQSVPPAPC
jgi:hypothetical protein